MQKKLLPCGECMCVLVVLYSAYIVSFFIFLRQTMDFCVKLTAVCVRLKWTKNNENKKAQTHMRHNISYWYTNFISIYRARWCRYLCFCTHKSWIRILVVQIYRRILAGGGVVVEISNSDLLSHSIVYDILALPLALQLLQLNNLYIFHVQNEHSGIDKILIDLSIIFQFRPVDIAYQFQVEMALITSLWG